MEIEVYEVRAVYFNMGADCGNYVKAMNILGRDNAIATANLLARCENVLSFMVIDAITGEIIYEASLED